MDITTSSNYVKLGSRRIPKGSATYAAYSDGYVLIDTNINGLNRIKVDIENDTIDGSDISDMEALTGFLDANLFQASGGGGVEGITGVQVDNSDPLNPVINAPTYEQVTGKPSTFAPAAHEHPFTEITGTATAGQIPTLAISKISGLQGALDAKLEASQGAAVADSVAADVATLVADFNALLASLRAAGIIAT